MFKLPCPQPTRPVLLLPKTFLDFPITREELEQASVDISSDQPTTGQEWGSMLETVVDEVLVARKHDNTGAPGPGYLPGRCMERTPKLKPFPKPATAARAFEFEPPCEVTAFGAKARIKQYRRLQSLVCQPRAHANDDTEKWHRTSGGLKTEWNTILKSYAFGPRFDQWMTQHPEIGPPRWPLPTWEWLRHVQQLLKFELDAHLAADRVFFAKFAKFKQDQEQKEGSRRHYAYLKGQTRSALTELQHLVEFSCSAHWEPEQCKVHLQAAPEDLQWGTPVFVHD